MISCFRRRLLLAIVGSPENLSFSQYGAYKLGGQYINFLLPLYADPWLARVGELACRLYQIRFKDGYEKQHLFDVTHRGIILSDIWYTV